MTDQVKELNRCLKEILNPKLEELSFSPGEKRTYRQIDLKNNLVKIINVQLGMKYMSGKFTINLGVYSPKHSKKGEKPALEEAQEFDCYFRKRLGMLVKSRWTRLFSSIFGPPESPLKGILYGSRDKWWDYSSIDSITEKSVYTALNHLIHVGIPWLDEKTKLILNNQI